MIDYTKLRIGDAIMVRVLPTNLFMKGTVEWIHPEKRFFRAGFVSESGERFHESFCMHPSETALAEGMLCPLRIQEPLR